MQLGAADDLDEDAVGDDVRTRYAVQQQYVHDSAIENNNEFGFDMSQLSKDFLMSKYIISIVSKAYLTQTINHMYQVPEYQVRVDFPAMIFTIKHNQVQEILWLIEFFNEYQYALKIERDLYKIRINRPDKSRLLKNKDS
jgi:hypothetical protein